MSNIIHQDQLNPEFLDSFVNTIFTKMLDSEHNGDYTSAEKYRQKFEQGKVDLRNKQLNDMNLKHKNDQNELTKMFQNELNNLNIFWEKKMDQYLAQGNQMLNQLSKKQEAQCQKLREQLQAKLSLKVKQSPQLLNLRKMQQQMAKQRNYVEAHRVQEKIKKIYGSQHDAWMIQRNQKISTALSTLKNRHTFQQNNLSKRIKTGEQQQTSDWRLEDIRIKQKYENLTQQLKAQQQRQVLSFKGQFKSRGGSSILKGRNLMSAQ